METYIRNSEAIVNLFRQIAKHGPFKILDTETTGLGNDALPVEFAGYTVRYKDKQSGFVITDQLHLYMNPGFLMADDVVAVHGITNDFVADKPAIQEAFQIVDKFLGDMPYIGAYNSKFDIRILQNFYRKCGKELNVGLEVDILKIAKDILCCQKLKNHKLGTVCNYYGVDAVAEQQYVPDDLTKGLENLEYHSAMYDAYSTVLLFNAMLKDMEEAKANAQQQLNLPLKNAKVFNINYWPGYRGNSRLYVFTSEGAMYYDIRNDMWQPKLPSLDLSTINMEDVEYQVFEEAWKQPQWNLGTGVINYNELGRICRNGAFTKEKEDNNIAV